MTTVYNRAPVLGTCLSLIISHSTGNKENSNNQINIHRNMGGEVCIWMIKVIRIRCIRGFCPGWELDGGCLGSDAQVLWISMRPILSVVVITSARNEGRNVTGWVWGWISPALVPGTWWLRPTSLLSAKASPLDTSLVWLTEKRESHLTSPNS